MGIEVIMAGVGMALAAGGAVYSNEQQKGLAKYANAQKRAAYEKGLAVQRAQSQVTALEKRRMVQDRYEAFKAQTRVSGAERGALGGRTEQALMSSLGIQAARESAKVGMEARLGTQNWSISNTPQWQVAQSSSPWLAGIQGGLQGLQMGIGMETQGAQTAAAQAQLGALQPPQTYTYTIPYTDISFPTTVNPNP